jgi:hypothetical protein
MASVKRYGTDYQSVDGGEIMGAIEQRLDEMETIISKPSFRGITGRANEVNYWVFDYPPQDELTVRERISRLQEKNSRGMEDFNLVVFNIYDIMMDYLESRKNYVTKTIEKEEKDGFERVQSAVRHTLRITNDRKENKIVEYITAHIPPHPIVFLTGVGTCYPILEAEEVFSKILYNMPSQFTSVPMVLFYPGAYTETGLIMFNEAEEGSGYYRAFRMVR